MINRYLFKQLFASFLLVFSMVAVLEFVLAIINELTYQTQADYQMQAAFEFLLMTTAGRLYLYSPIILLLAALVGLGGLSNRSELTILRASGLSIVQIVARAMIPMGLALALMFAMGELVAPKLEAKAQQTKAQLRGERQIGGWHREGAWVVHAGRFEANELVDVLAFKLADDFSDILWQVRAPRAQYLPSGQWLLDEAEVFSISDEAVILEHQSLMLPLQADPELLAAIVADPNGLSLQQNYQFLQYLAQQKLDNSKLALNFWQRIAQPFLALALILAGASFVFGSGRTMPMGSRIFIGLVAGIGLQLAKDLIGPVASLYQWNPMLAAFIPVIFALAAGLLIARKMS